MDIWASGIVMYFLLTGKHPFYNKDDKTEKCLRKMNDPSWQMALNCSEYY